MPHSDIERHRADEWTWFPVLGSGTWSGSCVFLAGPSAGEWKSQPIRSKHMNTARCCIINVIWLRVLDLFVKNKPGLKIHREMLKWQNILSFGGKGLMVCVSRGRLSSVTMFQRTVGSWGRRGTCWPDIFTVKTAQTQAWNCALADREEATTSTSLRQIPHSHHPPSSVSLQLTEHHELREVRAQQTDKPFIDFPQVYWDKACLPCPARPDNLLQRGADRVSFVPSPSMLANPR